jgi:hypothetical protein
MCSQSVTSSNYVSINANSANSNFHMIWHPHMRIAIHIIAGNRLRMHQYVFVLEIKAFVKIVLMISLFVKKGKCLTNFKAFLLFNFRGCNTYT